MSSRERAYADAMDGATFDRRGLLRQMLSGAVRAAVPGLAAQSEVSGERPTRGRLSRRTASIDELLDLASGFGLHPRAEALTDLARTSFRISPAARPTPGTVLFGGSPSLPRDVD